MSESLSWTQQVPLGSRTTLGVGGAAARFLAASEESTFIAACRAAHRRGEPLLVLGGGSNLVVADEGFPGAVVSVETHGVAFTTGPGGVHVRAAAGETWDDLVARCTTEGLSGLECLAGIPGRVGATPIQNVGAYGQEVADTLQSVRVFDLLQDDVQTLPLAACGFGYRTSRFKEQPGRFVVLEAEFLLRRGPAAPPSYPALAQQVAGEPGDLRPAGVRQAVLALRRSRSLVYDAADTESHSAGSFFLNPVVTPAVADDVMLRAQALGVLRPDEAMPRYPAGDGVKLAAAWLMERAGFPRGLERGEVGLSRHHALVLVNRGGAKTAQILELAGEIIAGVAASFGVRLVPEPNLVGFQRAPL